MNELTVSKLGERVGVSADTIRYYEKARLLPQARRTTSGYRVYEESLADRLRFIKGAQRLGLRLREIRELLDVLDRGICPCGHTEGLIKQRLDEINEETARLRTLKRELTRALEGVSGQQSISDGRWPCEDHFIEAADRAEGRNGA